MQNRTNSTEAASAQAMEQPRIISNKQRLTEAFLSDRGLQHITDVANIVFNNPFWLIDVNFNYLTRPQHELDPVLYDEALSGYVEDTTMLDLRTRGIYDQIRASGELTRYPARIAPGRIVMAQPIWIRSIIVGYVQLSNTNSPFQQGDEDLLRFLSRLASAEMQKNHYFGINRGSMLSSLLTDLLDGQNISSEVFCRRMGTLGVKVGRRFQLLSILPIAPGDEQESRLIALAEQIKYHLFGSLYVVRPGKIVLLVNLYGDTDMDAVTLATLEHQLIGNQVAAGLSPVFDNITACSAYLTLADAAVRVGRSLHPDKLLYRYDDYFLYHLLEDFCREGKNRPPLATSASVGVATLHTYDCANGTALSHTLRCYLDHLQNITQTAAALSIHGNTLRNRLDKIKELTGCPFQTGRQTLEYQLIFHAEEYRALLKNNS